jgi:hypothetical protein
MRLSLSNYRGRAFPLPVGGEIGTAQGALHPLSREDSGL